MSDSKITAEDQRHADELFPPNEDHFLSTCWLYFRSTGNPLWVFEAYRCSRLYDRPPPGWVLDYFDLITDGFLEESGRRGNGDTGGERAAFTAYDIIKSPLKKKKADIFNEYSLQKKDLSLVEEYETLRNFTGNTDLEIFNTLEKMFDIPSKTIESRLRKYFKKLNVGVEKIFQETERKL